MINNKTVETRIERLVLGIPRLVAIDGPLIGRTFYLDESVVSIGREWSNHIILEDQFVSRHHCVLRNEVAHCGIEDLNSANGTYVNGERVRASSLREGTIIQIGISTFVFRLQNPEEAIALSQNRIAAQDGHSSSDEIRLE